MIVDAHLHWYPGQPEYCPEELVSSGVIDAAWVLSANAIIYGQASDEQVIELCRKYPDFYVPFGYLDFDEAPPERIDYLYEQGCVGLKAIWPGKAYDAPACFPYYERAEALAMPCVFHVGGSPYWGPDKVRIDPAKRELSKYMMPITIDAVAKTFPSLTIVMAHLGGGLHSYDMANYIAHGHPNVYLDLSASGEDAVKEALRRAGPRKILFGSDGKYGDAVEKAQFWQSFLRDYRDDEVSQLIMGGNAARIVDEARSRQKRKDQV